MNTRRLALPALALLALAGCGGGQAAHDRPASPTAVTVAPTPPLEPVPEAPPLTENAPNAGAAASEAAAGSQLPPSAFVCLPSEEYKADRKNDARREAALRAALAAAAAAPPPPAPAPPPEVKPQPSGKLGSILGRKVVGTAGDDMGRVIDVLADQGGRARAAVIDFGGFLGVGNRRVAVDWRLLQFVPDDPDKPLLLSLSRQQVEAAPEFKDAAHTEQEIVTPPAGSSAR